MESIKTKVSSNYLPFIDSEESVKEHLVKTEEGMYFYTNDEYNECPKYVEKIEIPDRMNFAWKDTDSVWFTELMMGYRDAEIVWERHPQEESLNDKVASAEEARQKQPNKKTIDAMREAEDIINKKHSHYKKDVSHLEFIDVYRVLDLFEVESHAVGHAIKKLLCSGQRGEKGKAQDIQEAIDSLNRELEMMRENGNS